MPGSNFNGEETNAMTKLFKKIAKFISERTVKFFGINRLIQQTEEIKCMTAYMAWQEILKNDKYNDRRRLARHGFKVYSQADEDGIIQEIFNRIGTGGLYRHVRRSDNL